MHTVIPEFEDDDLEAGQAQGRTRPQADASQDPPRAGDIVLSDEDPLQSTSTVTDEKVLDDVSSLAIEGRRELNADEKERATASKSDVFRDKPSRE
jgi:hypothetical protein